MSTISSPAAADGHHHHLSGSLEQTLNDPFLPSSPGEEELLQLSSSIAASFVHEPQSTYQLTYSPTRLPARTTNDASCLPPNSSPGSFTSPHRSFAVHDHLAWASVDSAEPTSSFVHSQHHSAFPSPAAATDPRSPTVVYSTDAGYSELSEIGTPSFDNDFFLEANFGLVPPIEPEEDVQYTLKSHGMWSNDNSASQSRPSPYIGQKQRSSLGRADTSSFLLSPVLTNTPSPPTRLEQYRHLDMGPASISGDMAGLPTQKDPLRTPRRSGISAAELQHTPALTGSPSDVSLEVEPGQNFVRAMSPIVTVENYSRGDSPARSGLVGRTSSKRSRASRSPVHLSPYDEVTSSEDEVQDDQHKLDTRDAVIPSNALRTYDALTSPRGATVRRGINPNARGQISDVSVPNLREQEEHRHIAERNAEVEDWLARSEGGSDDEADQPLHATSRKAKAKDKRRRAKSMGDYSTHRADDVGLDTAEPSYDDSGIPGPGLLVDEDSGDEEYDSGDVEDEIVESPPAVIDRNVVDEEDSASYFPTVNEEPLVRQFYRSRPWQDPPYDAVTHGIKAQPATSNAAIMRFKQRAENIETASRAATWGTRRLSETDVDKIVSDGGLLKRLSFGREKDKNRGVKGERRGSFLEQAATKLLPKRSNSNLRRRTVPQPTQTPSHEAAEKSRKESLGSVAPSKLSKKSKHPTINTGSAVATMASQIAAIGGNGSVSATAPAAPHGPWSQAKSVMKRSRSRSELPDLHPTAATDPGLVDLMTQHGGPPMPTLASPLKEKLFSKPFSPPGDGEEEEPEDIVGEGEINDGKVVRMDLKIRADDITPTLEGFKSNVRQLNPRLAPFLVERIGHEQVRRYKKLIEFKVQHLSAVKTGKCTSGKHCSVLAAKVQPKANNEEEKSNVGLRLAATSAPADESSAFEEGVISAALFPAGVPLPPVKQLPAEFECPLCFKVKKFQKPSDWTKHVHEDVQPFTCTFPNCAEPKSFKRKADWVRHENERHRQLEWWTCNMPDCSHNCYRKDNFVQHLVREHKMPEPKIKASKGPARGAASGKDRLGRSQEIVEDWKAAVDPAQDEVDKVWALVEKCRHDTPKLPRDEACKFCGNVCNSWKKLTVHLAKHMEQISMPVLRLAEQKAVTFDTIVSPVEQRMLQQRRLSSSISPGPVPKVETHHASPYDIPENVYPPAGNLSAPYGMHDQRGYYGAPNAGRLQATNTYTPIPVSHFSAHTPLPTSMGNYAESGNTTFSMPSYQSYEEHPPRQFAHVNAPRGFAGPPSAQGGSSFDVMRGPVPTTRARYPSAGPPMPIYDPQQAFQHPMEGNPFLYHNTGGVAQPTGMSVPVAIQYDPITGVPYTQAPSGTPATYPQDPPNYPYRQ